MLSPPNALSSARPRNVSAMKPVNARIAIAVAYVSRRCSRKASSHAWTNSLIAGHYPRTDALGGLFGFLRLLGLGRLGCLDVDGCRFGLDLGFDTRLGDCLELRRGIGLGLGLVGCILRRENLLERRLRSLLGRRRRLGLAALLCLQSRELLVARQLAALRNDLRPHRAVHVVEQLDRHLVAADALDRVDPDLSPVDADLLRAPELVRDVGRRYGPEERTRRAGLDLEAERRGLQHVGDLLRVLGGTRLVASALLLAL